MSKKIILIDFDSVIANSSETVLCMFREYFNKDFDLDMSKLNWDFTPFAITEEEKIWCLSNLSTKEFFERLDMYEGFRDFLKDEELRNCYDFVLCTSREFFQKPLIEDWLGEDLQYFSKTLYLGRGVSKDMIVGDIIIDDFPKNLVGERQKSILFYQDRPCAYQKIEYNKDIIECNSWNKIQEFIKSILYKTI